MPKTISTKSPAYQRWVQKANAMAYDNPTRFRQIMSLVDDKFASEAMRKRVSNLRSAIAKEGRERTFGLASKRLSSGLALRKRETDIALKNMKTAKTLGYLNLPVSGALGYIGYKGDVAEADRWKKMEEKLYGSPNLKRRKTPIPNPSSRLEGIY
jgi:hypothetical protein